MQAGNLIIFLLIACLILWLKFRKTGVQSPARYRTKPSLAPSYICRFVLTKESPYSCIFRLDKRYGDQFENKYIPEPCEKGCVCEFHAEPFDRHDFFVNGNRYDVRETDLGELDFGSYKYYKYRLLELKSTDPQEIEEYRSLKDKIKVDELFEQQIESHIGDIAKEKRKS